MNEATLIEELITYSKILYERKLIHATGGNTSVRDGDIVWISQTGAKLGELTESEIVKVDLNGTVLAGSRPSKEMGMHLAMYRARPEAGAAIHAHPTFSIALSTLISQESEDAIPPYTAAFYVRAGRVPMIAYHGSGAHSLHEAVDALAPRYHALLLRQHGLLVAGKDMADTLGIVEEIEQCCQVAVAVGTAGECLTESERAVIDAALGRSWN
ncbi:MAG: class II aldolase/adducin family protein [Desulfocapsaceae bacterium]|jgi:ribulose-5-phosphate 4-epimerase/fuculose-1-phosphate aldolase|nr:class II aldolase/adducin family protein [Desulfocapsaceae bacterium]